jgi:mono/diheme cytochrome c family protein
MASLLPANALTVSPGEIVRVSKGEMLQFQGKNFLPAPKGQEFTVLQYQPAQNIAYVAFFKEDGSLIAVSLPANAVEAAPPNAWTDLLRGTEAFRDTRYDEARRLLTRAAQEPKYRALATGISARLTGYFAASGQASTPSGRQAFGAVIVGLRETAAEFVKDGYLCLALPLDEVAEKAAKQLSGGTAIPALASKIDRADVEKKVATSQRCVARARQAMSLRRYVEAKKTIAEGLAAEPERPELKQFEKETAKAVQEGDENFTNADRMRKFPNGTPHALTALEHGLKACADHPKLLALKKDMSGAVEARTAPPVSPALLTAARVNSPIAALEEGRNLYTSRCAECHDLELLDSRSVSGWEKAVAGMSGRAKLNDAQKSRIMEYITVAWNSLEAK